MNLCLDLCETSSSSAWPEASLQKHPRNNVCVAGERGGCSVRSRKWGLFVCVCGDANEGGAGTTLKRT